MTFVTLLLPGLERGLEVLSRNELALYNHLGLTWNVLITEDCSVLEADDEGDILIVLPKVVLLACDNGTEGDNAGSLSARS